MSPVILFSVISAVVAIVALLCTIAGLLLKFSKIWREEMQALRKDFTALALTMAEFKSEYVTRDQCDLRCSKLHERINECPR